MIEYYYRILPDISITFAPLKYILLFKFVWLLINVRQIVLFYVFIYVLISLVYSLVYIFVCTCGGVSPHQGDIEVRHEHYIVCSVNRNHGKSSVHSINFQYGSVARDRRNPNCLNSNQVFSNDWYAFVSSKSLFTFANIQFIFTCFIYITSVGNIFKLSIASNLLIAFFHIFSFFISYI